MQRRTLIGACGAIPFALRAARARDSEAAVPQPTAINLVTATPAQWNGHDCLAVELTDAEQALRLNTQGGGNRPSIAIVAPAFADGVIEASVAGVLTGRGAPDDRGFVGLSFHIGDAFLSHETVYLRMTNGRLNVPPPPAPRIDRAIYDTAHYEGFVAGSGEHGHNTNVRSLLKRIRKKFLAVDPGFAEIENRQGVGYCWREAADQEATTTSRK